MGSDFPEEIALEASQVGPVGVCHRWGLRWLNSVATLVVTAGLLAVCVVACIGVLAPLLSSRDRTRSAFHLLHIQQQRIYAPLYASYLMFSLFYAIKMCSKQNYDVKSINWTASLTLNEANSMLMGKEERKAQVLEMLSRSNLALTPYVLFRNLKLNGATFERRTLGNYLSELQEEGKVEKIEQPGNALYQITDDGRKFISKETDEQF